MANLEFNKEVVAESGITSNGTEKGITTTKKRKALPPMWRVLGKARNVFEVQLSKSNDVKLKCIENFMTAEIKDSDKFWSDFMEQVEKLLDSRSYVRECKSLQCPPENVAEHIVFLGSATINKVLKDGVKKTLGNDLKLYSERFSPESADKYRNDIVDFLKAA